MVKQARPKKENPQKKLFSVVANSLILITIILFVSMYSRFPFYFLALQGKCPLTQREGNNELYSQVYEDYILSAVFKDVSVGSYIDVGASNPNKISVTKYFYLNGWQGINIEPMEHMYKLLSQDRPRDINLKVGVGDKVGELEFYQIFWNNENEDSVLSTFDRATALDAEEKGFQYKTYKVPVTTLNNILTEYPMQLINFLKIDVEGFEKQVLDGLDFTKFRPEVFVIEATIPQTVVPSHQGWESILLENGYAYQLFDGLNRYYLRKESNALQAKFDHIKECVIAHQG